MENQENSGLQEQQYIKGFNNGYLLAEHEPDLLTMITAHDNIQNDYFKGLVSGKSQFEAEKAREWARSFSRGTPAKDERDLGKER